MDYSLAALKLLCIQLKAARPTTDSSQSSISLGPILFQRAWLQGVVISLPSAAAGRFLVDDGTGVVELNLANDILNRDWKLGAYVMVVGGCSIREHDIPMIKVDGVPLKVLEDDKRFSFHGQRCYAISMINKIFLKFQVHKIVDLSAFPHREAMWYLEVLEAYKLFYLPPIQDS
ncbi:hypothetical protein OSB04_015645 [Centaurea solstitialis]|uniref:RecQ-mediated genome instability protein 2 n=1 Tax=Centaurea solstitialis TaxID=347529 RepID=A0AA38WGR0_9ASTR|nr:hypothetical protein OSB04_015645 [Centaurea solstitialis]